MSDDQKQYWDEVEAQLNKIQQERDKEKAALEAKAIERRAKRQQQAPKEQQASKEQQAPKEQERVEQILDQLWDEDLAKQEAELTRKESSVHKVHAGLDEALDGFFIGATRVAKQLLRVRQGIQRRHSMVDDKLPYEKQLIQKRKILRKDWAAFKGNLSVLGRRFAKKEAWWSEKAAKLVAKADIKIEQWTSKAGMLFMIGCRHLFTLLEYMEHHKIMVLKGFSAVVLTVVVSALFIGQITAYEYIYNGKVLGIVKNQQDVYKTIDVIGDKLGQSLETEIKINKNTDITFHRVMGFSLKIDSKDDVLNSLTYMQDIKAKAYALLVDDRRVAIVQSKAIAEDLLAQIKERFAPKKEGIDYESVGFAQKVEVKEINTKLGAIQDPDVVLEYLLTGAVEKQLHVVASGDTFSEIAKTYNVKQRDLQLVNPGVIPERLKIGQEIILTQNAPLVAVETVEKASYTAAMDFEVVSQDTQKIYKGEKIVQTKGVKGKQQIEARIVRHNGQEVSREILSSEVLTKPVNQLVLVGTKPAPKFIATGNYVYPVRGAKLTSRFGGRWGRMHTGIDLACPTGTKVVAADGGTVTFAGYHRSYGNLVIIDHGKGKETYYAHNSKLLVKKGAKVYQGQQIAKVGNTGRSTGSHCHFEVRINGNPKNPLSYL